MMVCDIDERMPADEFYGWIRYMGAGPDMKKQKQQPNTAEGWAEYLRALGHEVKV